MKNESLFAELMAEVEKVNSLETEVNRAVESMTNEINCDREGKEKHIAEFISEIENALNKASVSEFIVKCCGAFHVWYGTYPVGIRFHIGRYPNIGVIRSNGKRDVLNSGSVCAYDEKLNVYSQEDGGYRLREQIIDNWSIEEEKRIEYQVAEAIKNEVKKRSEQAAQRLKDTNDKHDAYFNKN